MQNLRYEIVYEDSGGTILRTSPLPGSQEDFSLVEAFDGERLTVTLCPIKPMKMRSFCAVTPWHCSGEDRILLNGYQSWTDTRELSVRDRMPGLRRVPQWLVKKYTLDGSGDYPMVDYAGKRGMLHGFSYGYIRHEETYDFVGSMNERTGYTILKLDAPRQELRIEKECEELLISEAYPILDVVFLHGGYEEVFDRWFSMQGIPRPKGGPMSGYTSWYNHYQNITEQIILENLDSMDCLPVKADIFQIDDGFETAVGDWLDVDHRKFPNGMKAAADAIHGRNMLAGLWLAPFVCETKSRIYREHPDWLRRDRNGNPVKCGCNWSGYYALDLYNPEVHAYLERVFDMVLNVWGYDLVKLDFLFAADRVPTAERTRGQQMCEAMELLRKLVGDKQILGCGVPLMPAFGRVDFCRVGCDVSLDWDDKPYMRLLHRERVSTKNTICNTIYRRGLNGRAFWNDPDVFLLREENTQLSPRQKLQLATVNGLFGALRFTSDNYSRYDDGKKALYRRILALENARVCRITDDRKTIQVEYQEEGTMRQLSIRL